MKKVLIITIFFLIVLLILQCKQSGNEFTIPKSELRYAYQINDSITVSLSFIEYDKYNSIYLEFQNQSDINLILNTFLFPDEFIRVEKKIDDKFCDISDSYFKRTGFTMINGVTFGEGDTSARNILGSNYYDLNNESWFKNRDELEDVRKSRSQFFKINTKRDSLCVNDFLYQLNYIKKKQKIAYNIYINKSFKKGSVYKIYFSYPVRRNKSKSSFCYDLFDSLPPIKDFKPFKGNIVSDTLYLNCE